MKIGIVGCGIVGGACRFGFEKLGHDVEVHDTKLGTILAEVLDADIVYICVPTPMQSDGSCDTSIVEEVVADLYHLDYGGVVAIKSTVTPGTTQKLINNYTTTASSFVGSFKCVRPFKDIVFVPEFLRERCAVSDFVEHQKLLAVGYDKNVTSHSSFNRGVNYVIQSHGHYPEKVLTMTPTQAELLKYIHNTFNALRVVFANEFYNIASFFGEKYTPIKEGLLQTASIPDIYLDVNENMRGYSSICWNKDLPALIALCKKHGIEIPLIDMIPEANDKFKKTPFEGTRE